MRPLDRGRTCRCNEETINNNDRWQEFEYANQHDDKNTLGSAAAHKGGRGSYSSSGTGCCTSSISREHRQIFLRCSFQELGRDCCLQSWMGAARQTRQVASLTGLLSAAEELLFYHSLCLQRPSFDDHHPGYHHHHPIHDRYKLSLF
jgi:hypothetical protein